LETLIIDIVRENNAIKLKFSRRSSCKLEGINSVRLSTIDGVLKRMKPLYRATISESKSKDASMNRLAYIQTHSMLITLGRDLLQWPKALFPNHYTHSYRGLFNWMQWKDPMDTSTRV